MYINQLHIGSININGDKKKKMKYDMFFLNPSDRYHSVQEAKLDSSEKFDENL